MELINNSDLLPISSKLLHGEIGMNPDNEAALLNMSHCCRREAPEILTSSVITQLQEMAYNVPVTVLGLKIQHNKRTSLMISHSTGNTYIHREIHNFKF